MLRWRALLARIEGMNLVINGQPRDFSPPLTLAGLLEQMGMKSDRVAVELNRSIVGRDRWAETGLADGDRLEIVHFVGGGNFISLGKRQVKNVAIIYVGDELLSHTPNPKRRSLSSSLGIQSSI